MDGRKLITVVETSAYLAMAAGVLDEAERMGSSIELQSTPAPAC
jgi:hypothetical protein